MILKPAKVILGGRLKKQILTVVGAGLVVLGGIGGGFGLYKWCKKENKIGHSHKPFNNRYADTTSSSICVNPDESQSSDSVYDGAPSLSGQLDDLELSPLAEGIGKSMEAIKKSMFIALKKLAEEGQVIEVNQILGEYVYKILKISLIGDEGSGKTTFGYYTGASNVYDEKLEFLNIATITKDNGASSIQFWEIAWEGRLKFMRETSLTDSHVVLIFINPNNKTIEGIRKFVEECHKVCKSSLMAIVVNWYQYSDQEYNTCCSSVNQEIRNVIGEDKIEIWNWRRNNGI